MSEVEWNIPTLEKHLRDLLEAQGRQLAAEIVAIRELAVERMLRYDERFAAEREAANKAEQVLQRWQSNANEWRGALSDNARENISRKEYEAKHQILIEKIDGLRTTVEGVDRRATIFGAGWPSGRHVSLVYADLTPISADLGRLHRHFRTVGSGWARRRRRALLGLDFQHGLYRLVQQCQEPQCRRNQDKRDGGCWRLLYYGNRQRRERIQYAECDRACCER